MSTATSSTSTTTSTPSAPRRFPARRSMHPALHALIAAAASAVLGYATISIGLALAFTIGGAAVLALAVPLAWLWPMDRAFAGKRRALLRALIATAAWWIIIALTWRFLFLPVGTATGHSEWTILVGGFVGGLVGTLIARLALRSRTR